MFPYLFPIAHHINANQLLGKNSTIVFFKNTELRKGIDIDEKSSITIEALADFKVAKDDMLDNTMIFEGSQNPLTYARAFKGLLNRFLSICFPCSFSMFQ